MILAVPSTGVDAEKFLALDVRGAKWKTYAVTWKRLGFLSPPAAFKGIWFQARDRIRQKPVWIDNIRLYKICPPSTGTTVGR